MNKINAVAPRLSDEDPDPIEQDESEGISAHVIEGWLPWDAEDVTDIKRLISTKLPEKPRKILEAFLQGLDYNDIGVTEKHWRYHFLNGIEFIKQELKL